MTDGLTVTPLFIQIIGVLLGVVVLISGRRLFWLTVALIGFGTGLLIAVSLFGEQPVWLQLFIAILGGGIGILGAIFLQKVAVAVAGFFMGGFILLWGLELMSIQVEDWALIPFIIGGIIGAILTASLFEYALIGISALVGALMIVQVFNLAPVLATILVTIITLVGAIIQSRTLESE